MQQKKYGCINSIYLCRNINEDGCSEYDLNLVLSDYPYWEGDLKLDIEFKGIRGLKLGDIENLYRVCINIDNVSSNQWEEVKYRVSEIENDIFSFWCKDMKFKIC